MNLYFKKYMFPVSKKKKERKKEKPPQREAQAPQLESGLRPRLPEKSPRSNEDPAQP